MRSARVLYVASTSYSGSTLLDILMGQQPRCLSLGEFHRLGTPVVERIRSFGNRCSCRARLHDCEHWEDVRKRICRTVGMPDYSDWSEWRITPNESFYQSSTAAIAKAVLAMNLHLPQVLGLSWNSGIFREWRINANHSWMLYKVMANVTGQDTLVDSSKSPVRLWWLYKTDSSAQLKVIHLVRDGRGVAHSVMSRLNNGIKNGARFWARKEKAVRAVIANLPEDAVYLVRYEDLCNSPKDTIKSICDFVETEFDERNVVFPNGPVHVIPGNPMSSRPERKIRSNEKWREELSEGELREFESVAGGLNGIYGYKP